MHTREYVIDDANCVSFNYNSDLSGTVRVIVNDGRPFDVPGESLLRFVADYVRGRRTDCLENQAWHEILGIDPKHR